MADRKPLARRIFGPSRRELLQRLEDLDARHAQGRSFQKAEIMRVRTHYEALLDQQRRRGEQRDQGLAFRTSMQAYRTDPTTFRHGTVHAVAVSDLAPVALQWRPIEKRKRRGAVALRKDAVGSMVEHQAEPCDDADVLEFLEFPDPDRSMVDLLHEISLHLQAAGVAYCLKLYGDAPKAEDYTDKRTGEYDEAAQKRHRDAIFRYLGTAPKPGAFAGQVSLQSPDGIKAAKKPGSGRHITHFELTGASGFGAAAKGRTIHRDRVVFIRMPSGEKVADGIGWMEVAREDLQADNDLEQWQKDWLKNGGLAAVIEYPSDVRLSGDQRDDVVIAHAARVRSPEPEALSVLDAGGKYRELGASPKSVAVNDQRAFYRREKGTASGVPPLLEGDTSETHYNNGDFQLETFSRYDVGPEARRIWLAFSIQLAPDFGIAGLFFVPGTERDRFLGEDTAKREVPEIAEARALMAEVAIGTITPGPARKLLVLGHGYTSDDAKDLIPDDLYQSAPSPGGGLAFSAPKEAPKGVGEHDPFASAAEEWKAATWPQRLYIPKGIDHHARKAGLWTPERAAASVRESGPGFRRDGQRMAVCKRTAGISARLEAVNSERWLDTVTGYNERFRLAITNAINATSGNVTPEKLDQILEQVRAQLGPDLANTLGPLSLSTLEQSGAVAVDSFGRGVFELQEAVRIRHLSAFEERSEFMIDTVVQSSRNTMVRLSQEGATFSEIAREIDSYLTDRNPARSRLIVRTELGGAINAGMQEGYEFAGIESKEWVTLADGKVRDSHEGVGGSIIGVRMLWTLVGPKGQTVEVMHPRDLIRALGEGWAVINCRCVSAPVFED